MRRKSLIILHIQLDLIAHDPQPQNILSRQSQFSFLVVSEFWIF